MLEIKEGNEVLRFGTTASGHFFAVFGAQEWDKSNFYEMTISKIQAAEIVKFFTPAKPKKVRAKKVKNG